MKRMRLLLTWVLLCSGVAVAEDGFVPLFNGTDLTGWQGEPSMWRVDNGEIVGSTHGVKLKQNTSCSSIRSSPTSSCGFRSA